MIDHEVDKVLSGAEMLVQALKALEVRVIFAITGAGNLAILDALIRDGSIQIIYSHHEQAAVMEAQGYSRVTGELGVAIVTTGGGTSNAVTGILSAFMDSVPILVISGNESSYHCEQTVTLRAYGVQGFDSVKVLGSICKKSMRVFSPNDIATNVLELVSIARSERQGPVHLDVPMDIQRKKASNIIPENDKETEINFETLVNIDIRLVKQACKDLSNATKPMLYIGNGCRNSESLKLVKSFVEEFNIPFILSWTAIDLFPENHPLNVGRVGIYGDRFANILLQRSDFVLALGTRLAIPQLGYDRADFARKAIKWIVDIDPNECEKFEDLKWNVCNTSVTLFVSELKSQFDLAGFERREQWLQVVNEIKERLPRLEQAIVDGEPKVGFVHSAQVIHYISEIKKQNAIVTTDVGAALLSGHYIFRSSGNDRLITSQGLGEMGFGLPAAIGAYFADRERQIICLNTDGGIMLNLQELQVVKEHKIPLKLFIFNNQGYAMIRISQANLFGSRFTGSTSSSGISFPSFEDIAQTFGFEYQRIESVDDLRTLKPRLEESGSSLLIDVRIHPEQRYLPRLATRKLDNGELVSPPLEDLEPMISIELLEELLGYTPHPNSFKARNIEVSDA